MFKKSLIFSFLLLFFVVSTGLALNQSKRSRLGIASIENMKPNGNYIVSIMKDGKWVEVGKLSYDKYYRTRTLDLSAYIKDMNGKNIDIQISKSGGGAAHIDYIGIDGMPPAGVNALEGDTIKKKLSAKDYDVTDGVEEGEHIIFSTKGINNGKLAIVGRIEAEKISKEAFKFPVDNTFKKMSPSSSFYSYMLGQNEWKLKVDGDLNEVKNREPFFKEFSRSGSGHPSGYTYGWIGNDNEYLYASIDFTPDNTMDGNKDYAGIYISTPEGIKEYRVSMNDNKWGKPGFTYTDKAGYEHKVYELKIPLKEAGIDPKSAIKRIKVAFSAYGTAAPAGKQVPSVAFNSQNNQYLIVYYDYSDKNIKGQILDRKGNVIASEFAITDNASCNLPKAAYNAASNQYLVIWRDSRDANTFSTYGQIVPASGSFTISNFQISAMGSDEQQALACDGLNDKCLVVWKSQSEGPILSSKAAAFDDGVYGRIVDSSGNLEGTVPINIASESSSYSEPEVVFNPENQHYFVVFQGTPPPALSGKALAPVMVLGEILNKSGATVVDYFIINDDTFVEAVNPNIAYSTGTDKYLVVWKDEKSLDEDNIFGKLINTTGTSVPSEDIQITSTGNVRGHDAFTPSLSYDQKGSRFLVTWTEMPEVALTSKSAAVTSPEVLGQFISDDGTLSGSVIDISGSADYIQRASATVCSSECSSCLTAYEDDEATPGVFDIVTYLNGYCTPEIEVSAADLDFGDVDKNTDSATDLIVSNTGWENLTVSDISISGDNADQFTQTNDCTTLSKDESCTITVTFTPSSKEIKSATLKITSNDPDTPEYSVTISGTGIGGGGCGIVNSTSGKVSVGFGLMILLSISAILIRRSKFA